MFMMSVSKCEASKNIIRHFHVKHVNFVIINRHRIHMTSSGGVVAAAAADERE